MTKRYIRKRVFYKADECYAEAQRRIKHCAEKGKRTLDLSDLYFLAAIPNDILCLSNIYSLNISDCRLKEAPDIIGHITSLKKLSLHSESIPETFRNLINLQELSISGGFGEIPSWIGELKKLTHLSISGDNIKSIPPEIGNLNRLHSLVIDCKNISQLPSEIFNCPLVSMEISNSEITSFPKSFGKLKKMRKLILIRNKIKKLPDVVYSWEMLTELIICGPIPCMKTPSFFHVSEKTGNLNNLKKLTIKTSLIKQIPNSLGGCPLEELTLDGIFETLPNTFGNLSKLKKLHLDSSKLKSLPNSFGKLSDIEILSISTNENLKLPESFGNLRSLQDLSLYAKNMVSLPKSLGKCTSLKKITIESDALEILPKSFIMLSNLEVLILDTFALKEIPDSFGNLSALEKIDIFSGALTRLPESMGQLKKLKSIKLDAYNVQEHPKSFKNLSYVETKIINAGKTFQKSHREQKYKGLNVISGFKEKYDELKFMSYKYRKRIIQKYSLKELESLLFSAPSGYGAASEDRDIVSDILSRRFDLKYKQFKPSQKNILKIVEISEKIIKALEDGYARAKNMFEALCEKERDKTSSWSKYFICIKVYPEVLYKNSKTGEWDDAINYIYDDIYQIMLDYDERGNFVTNIHNESDFLNNIHNLRKFNYGGDPEMPSYFKNYHLCKIIFQLYCRCNWTFQDIAMINNIDITVEVLCRNETGVF